MTTLNIPASLGGKQQNTYLIFDQSIDFCFLVCNVPTDSLLFLLKTAESFQQDARSQSSPRSLRKLRTKVQLSKTLNSSDASVVIFSQQQIQLTVCVIMKGSQSVLTEI